MRKWRTVEVEITSDKENTLLNRREVRCFIPGVYGHLSRSEVLMAVSQKIKVDRKKIYAISIQGEFGTRDAKVLCYIYDREEDAAKDLPSYILKRNAASEDKPNVKEPQPKKDATDANPSKDKDRGTPRMISEESSKESSKEAKE